MGQAHGVRGGVVRNTCGRWRAGAPWLSARRAPPWCAAALGASVPAPPWCAAALGASVPRHPCSSVMAALTGGSAGSAASACAPDVTTTVPAGPCLAHPVILHVLQRLAAASTPPVVPFPFACRRWHFSRTLLPDLRSLLASTPFASACFYVLTVTGHGESGSSRIPRACQQ
jgi:hypothetical protein